MHCPSMAFRAPLQGRHIQRGDTWVAVFVIWATGRGGPHPKTQLTSPISPWLTISLATSSAGTFGITGLHCIGLTTMAPPNPAEPAEELEAGLPL